MPCGVGDEQDSVVFLVVRQIAAILVLPLHRKSRRALGTTRVGAGDSPAQGLKSRTGNEGLRLGKELGSGTSRSQTEGAAFENRGGESPAPTQAYFRSQTGMSTECTATNLDPSRCRSAFCGHIPRQSSRARPSSPARRSSVRRARAP